MARANRQRPSGRPSLVGREWTLDIGPIAHGGHSVARHDGQVVFVRHALPGERALVRITEGREGDRFVRGDAISIEAAAPARVTPPCRYAAERTCGGCDFQHVRLDEQRRLKAQVVAEQFARIAGIEVDVTVSPVPGDDEGLRWRRRVEFAVDREGRAGLRAHRSHTIEPVQDCLIATEPVIASGVLDTEWSGVTGVDVIDADVPVEPVLVPLPDPRRRPKGGPSRRGSDGGLVGETATDGDWTGEYVVAARGFWQVHTGAASTFLTRVMARLEVRPGDHVLDLFAGSGLFTMRLGELVGPEGAVLGVEGDARAVESGIENCAHLTTVEWRRGRVDTELSRLVDQGVAADLVVLDPPRSGAGREVMERIARLGPRRMVYVACDPAALARDVRTAVENGYTMTHLEAWDAFPMTHHVECIAVLEPSDDLRARPSDPSDPAVPTPEDQ